MRKLILKSFLSPGDIVMLTTAVRDLHHCYPNQFLTDVRTRCPELWAHNPFLTPLVETDPAVEVIDCSYPLIDRCNEAPYHCLHGYIDFLNQRLGLAIQPTAFHGDIHLSELEKSWYSQVHEVTGQDTPFWIIAAGGKYDVTIKWWDTRRYQEVVDYFRGKIQFVQIGEWDHHHPRLEGVIDLRGQTNLRELVRLVYHAQGVLCPITAVMHLAAAVEPKSGRLGYRPCVVVAGGREPAHWEAYPGHQFLHTNGALACCAQGGCWRDRTWPLGDGDERDQPEHLCVDVVGELPRCMKMISTAEVIRRIELYFQGGMAQYLTPRQAKAAQRGVRATRANAYDRQALTLSGARLACDQFIRTLPGPPAVFHGRGIVICGGGVKYFPGAWVCIRMLRRLGCALPIQLWHLGEEEADGAMQTLLRPYQVECIDASRVRQRHPVRLLAGWELKPYALLYSPFREVLLLDADNVPVSNPEFLFETRPYRKTGAIFWPDYGQLKKTQVIWDSCGLPRPDGPEFESGQIVVDKQRCWQALRLALWFNEHSDFYYQHLHGDKETFHLAFKKLRQPFAMPRTPIHSLAGTMCQHDWNGRRIFQHRNTDKWNLFLLNRKVDDFWFEEECRGYIRELQRLWDGRTSRCQTAPPARARAGTRAPASRGLRLAACMISCAARAKLRERTLRHLAATDWGDRPVHLQLDQTQCASPQERQAHASYLALRHGVQTRADYILLLEDDLEFNRFFYHNLSHWAPLVEGRVTLGGLYNPNLKLLACDVASQASIIDPLSIHGSQAFLLSRAAARHLLRHWSEVSGMPDVKMSRLAANLKQPIYYHTPSLVQHVGAKSVAGTSFHQAIDYDPAWKSEAAAAGPTATFQVI